MKSGAPWSIKGIEPAARETAKEKAREAGLTLGQWMNQVIAGAGHPAPAAPVAADVPAAGSALDTARLMRAIAEVARRVDVLSQQSPVPQSDLDARLAALDSRLEELARSSQAAAPEFDQARIERGLVAVVRRIEAMEQKALTAEHLEGLRSEIAAGLPAPADGPDLGGLENSVSELGRQIAGLQDISERLDRLESGIERIGSEANSTPAAATDPDLTENIRKLMNGMVNLATKIDGVEKRVDQRLDPVQKAIGDLQGGRPGIDEAALDRAVAAATAPILASLAELRAAPSRQPVSEPAPEQTPPEDMMGGTAGVDDDEAWSSPGVTVAATPAEPADGGEPVVAPDARPLHDLTDGEDLRVREFDDEADFFIDERPDTEIHADEPPEPEVVQEDPVPPAPDHASIAPSAPLDHVPTEANPPDRPQRLVPVESLLGGAPPSLQPEPEAPVAPVADPDRPAARDTGERKPFRLDEPLDLSRQTPAAPPAGYPGKRRWAGYLLVALFFIALFLGGFWFVGTPQFGIISEEISRLWAQTIASVDGERETGNGEPSGTSEPATAATPPAAATAPAPARAEPVIQRSEPAEPVAPAPASEAPPTAAVAPAAPAPAPAATPAPTASAPAEQPVDSELARLTAKAEAGDADAQYDLGVRYRDGIGTEANYSTAADWFESAAQQGHVPSQLGLGIMYRQGLGRPRDLDLAKLWLHAAARAGDADAQKLLGEVYVDSQAAAPDYFQAARWFRAAADQGVVDAQFNMGVLYEGGLGVPRDFGQAYYWFLLAAKAGDRSAPNEADRVAQQLTPEQRSEIEGQVEGFSPSASPPQENTGSGSSPIAAAPAASNPAPGDNSEPLRRRDEIRTLQELLIARGYDPGTPDGLPGRQTRDAIRQWQSDHGIAPDGNISRTVLNSLKSGG